MKKKIFFWSPFLAPIATPRAVINSAYAFYKYSSNYECTIINFFGEFSAFKKEVIEKNLKLKTGPFQKLKKYLLFKGKIKSRLSFLIIFILSFFPLKKLLSKEKPDYLIVQLITSLPMILLLLSNYDTKFILRISGIPRVTFFRKLLWKLVLKKFYLITCPTHATMKYIRNLNIVDEKKIKVLYDPIIEIEKIKSNCKQKNFNEYEDYYLAAGRLTKQKNFLFLCRAFNEFIIKNSSAKLLIAGDGEDKEKIQNYIKKNKLEKNIFLVGHVNNIYPLMLKAKLFILSSLWEDPGFVLIEASFCRTQILTSDCRTGPEELIKHNVNGFVYKSNNIKDFLDKLDEFSKSKITNRIKLNGLKMTKKFTLFNHYKSFVQILNN